MTRDGALPTRTNHRSLSASEVVLPLTDVEILEAVELVEVRLSSVEAEPLFERGLLPGVLLRVARRSPAGDPIVRVGGALLALRRETAVALRVRRRATER